jgi:hypothetical protein
VTKLPISFNPNHLDDVDKQQPIPSPQSSITLFKVPSREGSYLFKVQAYGPSEVFCSTVTPSNGSSIGGRSVEAHIASCNYCAQCVMFLSSRPHLTRFRNLRTLKGASIALDILTDWAGRCTHAQTTPRLLFSFVGILHQRAAFLLPGLGRSPASACMHV